MELLKYSKLFSDETERLKLLYGMDDNSVPPVAFSVSEIASKMLTQNCGSSKTDNEASNDEDSLGCSPLSPTDSNNRSALGDLTSLSMNSMSSSFNIYKPSGLKAPPTKKPKLMESRDKDKDVEPLDILQMLTCDRGQRIIASVRTEKSLSNTDQIYLMDRIHASVTKDRESPFKNYPETSLKIAIAKGIVKAFPELKCTGPCEWSVWLKITNTKFESVRRRAGARKNNKAASSMSRSVKQPCSSQRPKSSSTSTSGQISSESSTQSKEKDDLTVSLKRYMDCALPNSQNKSQISSSLASTFDDRRKWIHGPDDKPSCASVVREYKHLQSYMGEMLLEEFSRMEPLAEDFVPKFEKLAPLINRHTQATKKSLFDDVFDKFGHNPNLTALIFLPRLLPTTINPKTATLVDVAHMRKYKPYFEKVPTTSLLQIVPEGTDAVSYVSVESARGNDERTPIFPYLLWLTNDHKSGQIYLKIDGISFHVGSFPSDKDPVITSVEKLFKAHWVFNLNYHPYLHTVYNYFEVLTGICDKPRTSVDKLTNTLRELSRK